MSGSHSLKPKAGTLTMAVLLGGAALLGGCSDRDTVSAERAAQVVAAADRAEKAAIRAEEAAAKIEKLNQPTVVEADPDSTEDADDAAIAQQNEPASTEPDVKS